MNGDRRSAPVPGAETGGRHASIEFRAGQVAAAEDGRAPVWAATQCRKWRTPVKTMAILRLLAAAMTSASRTDPPGWIAAVAPAFAAAINPSAKGKNASLQTTLPLRESFASPAFQTAMRLASTRLIWPAPMP